MAKQKVIDVSAYGAGALALAVPHRLRYLAVMLSDTTPNGPQSLCASLRSD